MSTKRQIGNVVPHPPGFPEFGFASAHVNMQECALLRMLALVLVMAGETSEMRSSDMATDARFLCPHATSTSLSIARDIERIRGGAGEAPDRLHLLLLILQLIASIRQRGPMQQPAEQDEQAGDEAYLQRLTDPFALGTPQIVTTPMRIDRAAKGSSCFHL